MEPNELDLLPTDELVRLIKEASDGRSQFILPKHDDGVTLDFERYTFIELSHELARRTTALQAKIDGMIPRPKVVLLGAKYDDAEGSPVFERLDVNNIPIVDDDELDNTPSTVRKRLTTALGMDDPKEGGSDA